MNSIKKGLKGAKLGNIEEREVELAITEDRDVSGWQNIATAPKDGTILDLWVYEDRIADCSWLGGKWMAYGVNDFETQGWLAIQGDPSHWMPLPTAPKAEVRDAIKATQIKGEKHV